MITDQENGLLVQPKNSRQLAEKTTYLLNNPEIAKKLAQKARSKVEREFTLQRMIDQTKDLY
jgi:glycosyltransferase involved in cell wall biosynthesis